jgi:hypothetical protein
MRDSDTACSHHFYQVTIAQFVGDVPTDTENDDRTIEMATTEERG